MKTLPKPYVGMWLRQRMIPNAEGYWEGRECLDKSQTVSGLITAVKGDPWPGEPYSNARIMVTIASNEAGYVASNWESVNLFSLWQPIPHFKKVPKWMPRWAEPGRELTFSGPVMGFFEDRYRTVPGSKFIINEVRGTWVRLDTPEGKYHRLIMCSELVKHYTPMLNRFERVG